ncbi:hypothetical protein [Mucilaginibacter aquatilis]|uniref:Uncharacterized protein n=1 Tax=Mucilaginibacter aquatilis TaxID=1517760 RepID=A0A6I4IQE1_9SPHI|nr:hypothetical protein [Mucilaginibacter aquatilis]MVN91523.1 hypothetical protein [Mucilaginibacter aquatilis]
MNEPFILEVDHADQVLELHAAFQRYGYTYRIAVSINDQAYVFEPDEEGNYRVLGTGDAAVGLLHAIADRLKQLSI